MSGIVVGTSIILPVLLGICILFLRTRGYRNFLIVLSSAALMVFSAVVIIGTPFVGSLSELRYFNISTIITVCDLALMVFLIYISARYKRIFPIILTLFQLVPFLYIEFWIKPYVEDQFRFNIFLNDNLSLVMLLLILLVGPLIAIFGVKYMEEYEKHQKVEKSRQPYFFFVIFLFLGAMSGLVLANNLLQMFFFWEVTTLCSFLLIGFSKTEEAINNAFRALWMNLVGGVAFIFAILLFYNILGTFKIDEILMFKNTGLIGLPLALIAIAAFTKAAQFPFQSWLLGAMVAPTPVSALLHSSTMVKAGVYLLVRFSPLFEGTQLGYGIAILGSFSFFGASALAIGQSNGKRVLAYSTIANLGLIVATAGIGTPTAITAAILLMIFHGVSKALLFLCVGTIEHGIGSRDVEDMDGLISKMPLIGSLTAIGMFSMLLPPFGVIITKLLSIEAASNTPVILLFITMGSALTVVFWAKWMGKILTVNNVVKQRLENYSLYTVIPLGILALDTILVSVGIVQLYHYLVRPYIQSNWLVFQEVNFGSMLLIPIFIAVLCLFLLIPIFLVKSNKMKLKNPYLCGENSTEGGHFVSISDQALEANIENYYLGDFFKEEKLTFSLNVFAIGFIIFMFGVIL